VRQVLGPILQAGQRVGAHRNEAVFESGDLPRDVNGHECHRFRWRELSDLLSRHGHIVAASASNFLSVQNDAALDAATDDEREMVLGWEIDACLEPGLIEAGTHMLVVVQKEA
jgi:hypothetical protein